MRLITHLSSLIIKALILIPVLIISCEKQESGENRMNEQDLKNAVADEEINYITLFSETFTITSKDALNQRRILDNPDIDNSDDFTITVRNGKSGKTKVSRMEIRVDGELVITFKDFRGNAKSVTKKLPGLTTSSTIDVKIAGSIGRFIEVIIKGTSMSSSVKDVDGNLYRTVKIGDQWWMAENLKTTRYNDGTSIPEIADNTEWLNVAADHMPAFCWYDNNSGYKATYGAIYNWEAAGNGKICPEGWRLPDEVDFYELCLYIDPESAMGYYSGVAGGALKETGTAHWESPNTGATDEYGFTALPGGYRNVEGTFASIGKVGNWWSDSGLASMGMTYNDTYVSFSEGGNEYGRSIRCIKE